MDFVLYYIIYEMEAFLLSIGCILCYMIGTIYVFFVNTPSVRCYDLLNIFAEKFSETIGVFYSK
jgi:hypothetical protein